jgi:predicted ATPase
MPPDSLLTTGLKVAKYKCFRDVAQGFDQILPFNLIIGRNNTGKSALLDVLAYIVTRQSKEMLTLDGNTAAVILNGLKLTRFRGHLTMLGGVRDGKETKDVFGGVAAAAGTAGSVRSNA